MGLSVKALRKTVATSGTEEALAASQTLCTRAIIKALAGNNGDVFVGANGVSSTTGFVLDAGESVELTASDMPGKKDLLDLSQIYIDVGTNGEGVSVLYFGN